MSSSKDKDQINNPPFQTPNPTELKKAAKIDPIQERDPDQPEADVYEDIDDAERQQFGRQGAAEMANSPITQANRGGH
ncbi:hypothetical protein H6F43_11305 [Leptolyngbya sp. FACHB-36]|uniref:hypothetical protein n=1 Tax=Leptolyngbya sp. FACHB-36 TaxID=2692808 RepID=UPI00167FF165|nr:hypothetical protein [Leptolyngbya sp. FACHB-36]MBD2020769.1 hypothetical protein [Leptolyngbya sp. FACHB-36]